jgi:hypothetical protein
MRIYDAHRTGPYLVYSIASRVNFGWLVKPWSPVDPDLVMSRSGFGADAYELICDEKRVIIHQAFVRHRPEPLFTPYPF